MHRFTRSRLSCKRSSYFWLPEQDKCFGASDCENKLDTSMVFLKVGVSPVSWDVGQLCKSIRPSKYYELNSFLVSPPNVGFMTYTKLKFKTFSAWPWRARRWAWSGDLNRGSCWNASSGYKVLFQRSEFGIVGSSAKCRFTHCFKCVIDFSVEATSETKFKRSWSENPKARRSHKEIARQFQSFHIYVLYQVGFNRRHGLLRKAFQCPGHYIGIREYALSSRE